MTPPFTNYKSAGFAALLNVRLNDSAYTYNFGKLIFYSYVFKSSKTLSKLLLVGRVSGEKGPE